MNIVIIVSNKGGVGKTSIALSAGFYFSTKPGQETLLMELDNSPGDFGPIFDIDSNHSLELALRFPENADSYLKKVKQNLHVLKGITDPFIAENISSSSLYFLLKVFSEKYHNIIIDTQTVVTKMIIDVIKLASKVILLTDYTLESISRVFNLYENLTGRHLINRDKICLIVNKKSFFDCMRIWDFSRIADMPVNGFISYDKNFNKNIFMANAQKVSGTRLYRQLGRIIENGFNKDTFI